MKPTCYANKTGLARSAKQNKLIIWWCNGNNYRLYVRKLL